LKITDRQARGGHVRLADGSRVAAEELLLASRLATRNSLEEARGRSSGARPEKKNRRPRAPSWLSIALYTGRLELNEGSRPAPKTKTAFRARGRQRIPPSFDDQPDDQACWPGLALQVLSFESCVLVLSIQVLSFNSCRLGLAGHRSPKPAGWAAAVASGCFCLSPETRTF